MRTGVILFWIPFVLAAVGPGARPPSVAMYAQADRDAFRLKSQKPDGTAMDGSGRELQCLRPIATEGGRAPTHPGKKEAAAPATPADAAANHLP